MVWDASRCVDYRQGDARSHPALATRAALSRPTQCSHRLSNTRRPARACRPPPAALRRLWVGEAALCTLL